MDHRYLLAIGWPSHYFLEKILFTEGDALPIKDQAWRNLIILHLSYIERTRFISGH